MCERWKEALQQQTVQKHEENDGRNWISVNKDVTEQTTENSNSLSMWQLKEAEQKVVPMKLKLTMKWWKSWTNCETAEKSLSVQTNEKNMDVFCCVISNKEDLS